MYIYSELEFICVSLKCMYDELKLVYSEIMFIHLQLLSFYGELEPVYGALKFVNGSLKPSDIHHKPYISSSKRLEPSGILQYSIAYLQDPEAFCSCHNVIRRNAQAFLQDTRALLQDTRAFCGNFEPSKALPCHSQKGCSLFREWQRK
jgi:hypothetical protein